MVLALPNGEQKNFSTLRACEVQADLLPTACPHAPETTYLTEYRCEAHKPIFLLVACKWYGRSCYRLKLTSLHGCTAYHWLVHLRDRNRIARRYEWPLIMNDFALRARICQR